MSTTPTLLITGASGHIGRAVLSAIPKGNFLKNRKSVIVIGSVVLLGQVASSYSRQADRPSSNVVSFLFVHWISLYYLLQSAQESYHVSSSSVTHI